MTAGTDPKRADDAAPARPGATTGPTGGPGGDGALEAAFAALRADAPRPSAALMARVLADAEAAAPRHAPPAARRAALIWRALGGLPAAAGLAAATLAGVWIGADPPGPFAAGLWPAAWDLPATLDLGALAEDVRLDGFDPEEGG